MKKTRLILILVCLAGMVSAQIPANWKLVKTISCKGKSYQNTSIIIDEYCWSEFVNKYNAKHSQELLISPNKAHIFTENINIYKVTEPDSLQNRLVFLGSQSQTRYCNDVNLYIVDNIHETNETKVFKKKILVWTNNHTFQTGGYVYWEGFSERLKSDLLKYGWDWFYDDNYYNTWQDTPYHRTFFNSYNEYLAAEKERKILKLKKQEDEKREKFEKIAQKERRDSLTNAIREISRICEDRIKLNFDNSLFMPINDAKIYIENFYLNGEAGSCLVNHSGNSLLFETNEALWLIRDVRELVKTLSFDTLSYSNALSRTEAIRGGNVNFKIPKVSRITVVGENDKTLVTFEPTLVKDSHGKIQSIQLAKFDSLYVGNNQLRNQIKLIQQQCKIIEAPSSNGKFIVKLGEDEKTLLAQKNKWRDLWKEWDTPYLERLSQPDKMKYSQSLHNLLYFELLKPQGYSMPTQLCKLYIYETDDSIYIGNSYLSTSIITNDLSDDVLKVDKNQAFQIKSIYWDQNTTYGGGKYKQKTIYKYKPKKK